MINIMAISSLVIVIFPSLVIVGIPTGMEFIPEIPLGTNAYVRTCVRERLWMKSKQFIRPISSLELIIGIEKKILIEERNKYYVYWRYVLKSFTKFKSLHIME